MVSLARLALLAAILAIALPRAAVADADANANAEKEKLAQCGKDVCSIANSKKATGPDVSCDLVKTWQKADVQKAADYMNYSWGLGSAKCTVKLTLKRADLVAALTEHEYTFKFGKQHISCEIGDDKYTVSATVAPELTFKDGIAKKGTLQMDDIQGAALIKGVVWTAAALERNFGLFESDLVREVNRFLHTECPKYLTSAPVQKAGTHK
jgi:hypothetical protein